MTDEVPTKFRKKGSKKGSNVPACELGFKPKVYIDFETSFLRRRKTKFRDKNKIQGGKQSFMSNFTFFIDPLTMNAEEINDFKGVRKSEWQKIQKINFRTREKAVCCICLDNQFVAPQITHCGHIFCWHCIQMHHYKSLKANNCPVCNQPFSLQQLVTCQPIQEKYIRQNQKNVLKFNLRCKRKGDNRIYNPETLIQEVNFSKVVKITRNGLLMIYEEEVNQIMKAIQKSDDEQVKKELIKVLSLSQLRVDSINNKINEIYKLHKYQKLVGQNIMNTLMSKETKDLVWFYQQASGRLIFLHNMCNCYLNKQFGLDFPKSIEGQVYVLQESQYSQEMMPYYKELDHLGINQEIDFVILKMNSILSQELEQQFIKQFSLYKERKRQQNLREEKQAERLRVIYEEEKQYMKSLKKIASSEVYDIYLPPMLNPHEITDHQLFPSLFGNSQEKKEIKNLSESIPKKKSQKKQKMLNQSDFPELFAKVPEEFQKESEPQQKNNLQKVVQKEVQKQNLKKEDFPDINSSTQEKQVKRSKKKKKKNTYVDVTQMFFRQEEQQEY